MSRVGKRGLGRGIVVAVRKGTVRAFLNLGETLAPQPTQLRVRVHLVKLCEYTYLLIHSGCYLSPGPDAQTLTDAERWDECWSR